MRSHFTVPIEILLSGRFFMKSFLLKILYSYLHYFSIKTIDNINVLYIYFLLPGCIIFDLEIYRYLLSRSDLHRYRYANRSTGIIGYITRMLFHLCLIVKCQVRWSRNLSFDICNWYTHSVVIYICIYYTIPSTVKLCYEWVSYWLVSCPSHVGECPAHSSESLFWV